MNVPAIRHAFTEYPDAYLYLDTSFLLNALVPGYPYHEVAASFLLRLAEVDITTLCISSLTWLEFGYVVLRHEFRAGLAPVWQEQYALAAWDQPAVREIYQDVYLSAMVHLLLAVLSEF